MDNNKTQCNTNIDTDNTVNCNTDITANIDTDKDTDNTVDNTQNTDSNNVNKDKNYRKIGNGNLIPFNQLTEEQQREIRSKGGKASAEAKKKKKTLNEIAKMMFEHEVKQESIEEILGDASDLLDDDRTLAAVLTARMAQEAGKGNYKAYEVLRDTAGYKPKDQMEIETITDGDRALMANIQKRLDKSKNG